MIPRGRPIDLKGSIRMGESKTDLGGLWVRNVDLRYKAGDHFIEFREPLPFPMDRFKIEGSMGGLEIRGLGQASPSTVEVKQGMGELSSTCKATGGATPTSAPASRWANARSGCPKRPAST